MCGIGLLATRQARDPEEVDAAVRGLLEDHLAETGSAVAQGVLEPFDPSRCAKVATRLQPEAVEEAC